MTEPGESWAAWLRDRFDSHPEIRRPADLVKAGGVKENSRPKIDASTVTQWLRGRRPSYELAVETATAFGVPPQEALAAAGYPIPGQVPPLTQQATGTVTPPRSTEVVGLGLDDEARRRNLTPEQLEAVLRVIRNMGDPTE